MLDVRVYRAAFLPALIALFIAAFSLGRPSRTARPSTRSPRPRFDGGRAYTLARRAGRRVSRAPAGIGRRRALAGRVAQTFARQRLPGHPARHRTARTVARQAATLETVVGVRPGLSSRRIVVIAHRDSLGSPALAELSGTAALLELARVFKTRELRTTLVLVSTSGGSAGARGARDFARRPPDGPVDAVIVLGDIAGRDAAQAVGRAVVQRRAGGADRPPPHARDRGAARDGRAGRAARARSAQWARRALPLTVSEQGEAARAGLPAVLLSASGERGPGRGRDGVGEPAGRVRPGGAARGHRARPPVARADEAGPFANEPVGHRHGPQRAARLGDPAARRHAAAAAAADRPRRVLRRPPPPPAGGALARLGRRGAVPFLLAWLWLRMLGLVGAVDAPLGPVLPDALPLRGWNIVALVSAPLVLALTWIGVRGAIVERLRLPASVSAGGAAAALGLAITGLAALVWLVNPFAAALLLRRRARLAVRVRARDRHSSRTRILLVLLGLVLPAVMVLHYGLALGLGPLDLAWLAVIITAGGHVTPLAALFLSVLAGRSSASWPSSAPAGASRAGPSPIRSARAARSATRVRLARRDRVGPEAIMAPMRRWVQTDLQCAARGRAAAAGRRGDHAGVAGARVGALRQAPAGTSSTTTWPSSRALSRPPTDRKVLSRLPASSASSPTRRACSTAAPPTASRSGASACPRSASARWSWRARTPPRCAAGPGTTPGTPLPGARGTVAIAGHRTTYGAWFRRLDKLNSGDKIELTMPYGRFTYAVERTPDRARRPIPG